ncbi:MAG: (S)-benzoin forming benzil reductase [Bacteroidetes bacterium]|nr:(S)-benzoin forming benzil reductase [Bacteroidota bacterium]HET6242934.1 (S)-benzoin forming benzil reductase [Bacteroidia bacterium]
MIKVAIVTGGSKGIGKALVKTYSENGYTVYSIARTKNTELKNKNIKHILFDLSNTIELEEMVAKMFKKIKLKELDSITLINNAGSLGKIKSIEKVDVETVQKTIALNTTAPMVLSALFIRNTSKLSCIKKIINISSGAAKNPYAGWTMYCSTKAALDMMTKTIALEQQELPLGVKIISLYPGVVETAMQEKIRKTPIKDFKSVGKFIDLKEQNLLADPIDVASAIFSLDEKNQFANGEVVSLK